MFWQVKVLMDATTYTAARNRLAKTMDKVNDDGTPVLITREQGPAHLFSSPRNAARLRRAVRTLKAGKGRARKLVK